MTGTPGPFHNATLVSVSDIRLPKVRADLARVNLPGSPSSDDDDYPVSLSEAVDLVLYVLHQERVRGRDSVARSMVRSLASGAPQSARVSYAIARREDLFSFRGSDAVGLTEYGRSRATEEYAKVTSTAHRVTDAVFDAVYWEVNGLSREELHATLDADRDIVDTAIGWLKSNGDVFEGYRNGVIKITDAHRAERTRLLRDEALAARDA